MNKNMGKFLTHLAIDEWDGYMTGKGQIFEAMVRDEEAQCDVYVFAPELSRERWEVLIVTYGGSKGCSKGLHTQINKLAAQLGASITYVRGDE